MKNGASALQISTNHLWQEIPANHPEIQDSRERNDGMGLARCLLWSLLLELAIGIIALLFLRPGWKLIA